MSALPPKADIAGQRSDHSNWEAHWKRQAVAAPLASHPRSLFLLLFGEHFHCRNGSTTSQSKFFFLPSLSGIAKAAPFVELDRICIVGSHLHDYFSVWVQQLLYFTPNCTADAKTLIFW